MVWYIVGAVVICHVETIFVVRAGAYRLGMDWPIRVVLDVMWVREN